MVRDGSAEESNIVYPDPSKIALYKQALGVRAISFREQDGQGTYIEDLDSSLVNALEVDWPDAFEREAAMARLINELRESLSTADREVERQMDRAVRAEEEVSRLSAIVFPPDRYERVRKAIVEVTAGGIPFGPKTRSKKRPKVTVDAGLLTHVVLEAAFDPEPGREDQRDV